MAPLPTMDRVDSGRWHVLGIAAALPVLSHGAAMFIHVEPGRWLSVPEAVRWALAADAMLYTAGCAIVAGPIAGVATAAAGSRGWRGEGRISQVLHAAGTAAVACVLFTLTSGLLSMAWRIGQPDASGLVVQSHATMLSVGLALAAWGGLCGTLFRDPLDAAACSVLVALTAAGGLLVAGAPVADLPRPMLAWGLTANPLVVIASASHIDIVRTDLLYQISPLAHVQFDYPSSGRASAWYLAVALLCFVGMTCKPCTSLPASAI